jgi:chemotaxis protein MotB
VEGMKRNVLIVSLSVLLAASIILGFILYGRYSDSQKAVIASENKSRALNDKVAQLEQKNSSLQEEIRKYAGRIQELKNTKGQLAELKGAAEAKAHEISDMTEKLQRLEKECTDEKQKNVEIGAELSSKDSMLADLKQELRTSESYGQFMEEGTVERKNEIAELQSRLSKLDKEKRSVETRLNQLSASSKAAVDELKKQSRDKDAVISECRGQIGKAQVQTTSLKQALEKAQAQMRSLENKLTALEKEKSSVETRLTQLTTSSKAVTDELKEEIRNRDADISKFHAQLKRADSQALSLKEEIESARREISELQARLSELGGEKARITTKIDRMESSYKSLLSDLKKQIANKEVTIERIKERMTITFVDRILFEFGKATITPEGKENLKKVGETLRNVGNKMIKVVGHTDDIPIMREYRWKFPSNWELSSDRAAAVVRYFQELGVDPANMEAVGRSFYDGVANNETPEGRAENRRVNIIIAPKIGPDFER